MQTFSSDQSVVNLSYQKRRSGRIYAALEKMGKQAYRYVSVSQRRKNLGENGVSKSEKTEGGQQPAQELMEVTCWSCVENKKQTSSM